MAELLSLTHDDVNQAIAYVRTHGVPARRGVRKYALVVDGEELPPAYVVAMAARRLLGREARPHEIVGGSTPIEILKELGFTIRRAKRSSSSKRNRPAPSKQRGRTRNDAVTPSRSVSRAPRAKRPFFRDFLDLLLSTSAQHDRRGPREDGRARHRVRTSAPKIHTVHRVRQKYPTSCGVAAVAMFARVSHARAFEIMFPTGGTTFYTHYGDVRRALERLGVSHGGRPKRFSSWDAIPTTSLVKVKWEESGKIGYHWVIFQRLDEGGWRVLDPGVRPDGTLSLARADLDYYRGLSYLPVAPRLPTA